MILCVNFVRISVLIGLFHEGAIAQVLSPRSIEAALDGCGVRSLRRRDLSLEAMVCYAITMGLFRQVSTREVLRCLADGLHLVAPGVPVRISGKSSISRAASDRRDRIRNAEKRIHASGLARGIEPKTKS